MADHDHDHDHEHEDACPSSESLFGLLVGALPEPHADSVADHVESCIDCQATLDTFDKEKDTFVAGLRDPALQDPYTDESARREALAGMKAMAASAVSEGADEADRDAASTASSVSRELGEYRLLDKLGQGGMGTVYRAVQTKLDKVVAVKILPKSRMEDEGAVARFSREMRAVGKLNHPNIVQALDAREIDGMHFLVIEHVEGMDLSDLARRLGVLPIADACELVRQAAEGLQHVHEHKLVHRDIKPSNLMLTRTGQVKILDLGLALLNADQAGREMTATGQAMGTADYMAPEQANDAHAVDIRADLYSLGCTLYRLLTGRVPFTGSEYRTNIAKLMAHINEPPAPLQSLRADVPKPLARLLDQLLSKSPDARPATPADVAAALTPLSEGSDLPGLLQKAEAATTRRPTSPPEDPPAPQPAPAPAASRWNPKTIALALLPFFFIALGIVLWINNTRIEVPDGSDVTVDAQGDVHINTPQPAQPNPPPPDVSPEHIESGDPLARQALVTTPAVIPGLKSWTIETVGTRGTVSWLALSPDGKTLAVGDFYGTIRLWDVEQRSLLRAIPAYIGAIRGLSWSRDSDRIASAEHYGWKTKVWEVNTAALAWEPDRLSCAVGTALAWSPDGRLYVGHTDGKIRQWDISATPPTAADVDAHEGTVTSLAWSPDGTVLASGGQDGAVRYWTRQLKSAGEPVHAAQERANPAGCTGGLMWSPNGKSLACAYAGDKGTVATWDFGTDGPSSQLGGIAPGAYFGYTSVAWSPDGRLVAATPYQGKTVRVWDRPSSKLLWERGEVGSRGVCFLSGGKTIATAGRQGVEFWDAQTGECLDSLAHHGIRYDTLGDATVITPDGRLLVMGFHEGNSHSLRLWDVPTGEMSQRIDLEAVPASIAISDDGRWIAVREVRKCISIWEVASGRRVETLPEKPLARLAWSPDARTLAVCAPDGGQIWDVSAKSSLCTLPAGAEGVAFSPDGSAVALSSKTEVYICDAKTGQVRQTIPSPMEVSTVPLAWSPDGSKLAAGAGKDDKHHLWIWDIGSEKMFATWQPKKLSWGPIPLLSWNDNTLVIGNKYAAHLWDITQGKSVRRKKGLLDRVFASRELGGFARGGAVRIHRHTDGATLRTFLSLRDGQWAVISPDGHFRGSPGVEKEFVYVALTDEGHRLTLTPDEFATRYAWKNDPEKALQTPEQRAAATPNTPPPPAVAPFDLDQAKSHQPEHVETEELLSPLALVTTPAVIPTLKSWTVETVGTRVAVTSLSLSPDDKTLATGDFNGTIRLWDAKQRSLLRAIPGYCGTVAGLCWSPDSTLLASHERYGRTTLIHDVSSGALIWKLADPKSEGQPLAWSPDGQLMYVGLTNGRIRKWDLSVQPPSHEDVDAHKRAVHSLAWSPDGTVLASSATDGEVRYWTRQLKSATESPHVAREGGEIGDLGQLTWSPDGKSLACAYGGEKGRVTTWKFSGDTKSPQLTELATCGWWGYDSVAWSPDGALVAAGPYHGKGVQLWNRSTGELLWEADGDGVRGVCFLPDGKTIVTGGRWGVEFWAVEDGKRLDSPVHQGFFLGEGVYEISAISSDGRLLATPFRDGSQSCVVLWDVPTGEMLRRIDLEAVPWRVTVSDDGRWIAVREVRKCISIWEVASGRRVETLPEKPLSRLAWSPDARTLAVCAPDGGQIWDISAKSSLCTLPAGAEGVAFSPDGSAVAVSSKTEVNICDAKTGQVRQTIPSPMEVSAVPLAWSPDGSKLAAAAGRDYEHHLWIWDIASEKMFATWQPEKLVWGAISVLRWNDDTLVVGNSDMVHCWDITQGKSVRRCQGLLEHAFASRELVGSARGGAVRIHRQSDGASLRTFLSLRDGQWAVISPDGHFRGSPGVEKEFVYVALTDEGHRLTLTPDEFATRYAWKNDPKKALQTPEQRAAASTTPDRALIFPTNRGQ